jgi:hypothetical protein
MHEAGEVDAFQLKIAIALVGIDYLRLFRIAPTEIAAPAIVHHPGIAPVGGLGDLISGIFIATNAHHEFRTSFRGLITAAEARGLC